MTDGYRVLGIERNPFVADPNPGVEPVLWLDRPIEPPEAGEVVELIGPRGSGKTSLLLHWQRRRPGPYVHVEADRSRWRPPPVAEVVYWDEADRIPALIFRRSIAGLAALGAGAAIGTHVGLGRKINHRALSHRSVVLGRLSRGDVQKWAQLRIESVATGPTPRLTIDDAFARRLADGSGGSWRQVGDELHAWTARLAAEPHNTAP